MSRVEAEPITVEDLEKSVRLPVTAHDRMIIDELRAGLIRERDLDSQTEKLLDAPSVIVDLNEITALEVHAAYELLGMWIFNLQREREKAGKKPIPVVIEAKHLDILRTVHAALRGDASAYALVRGGVSGKGPDQLIPIGIINTTRVQRNT